MKKINLIFYNLENYGDALNPFLFRELSGLEIQNKDYLPTLYKVFRRVLSYLFSFDKKWIKTSIMPWQHTILGVGSIIRMSNKRTSVWGAGFMNEGEKYKGGQLYAVRGRLTSEKLAKEGYPICNVYGDPALLLPLWIAPTEKKIKIALIPHFKEVEFFKEKYGHKYHIIDLRSREVEAITKEISSCQYVLSTSLHGLIVAHSYGTPALWIKKGYIDTDGFKFHDYFSSVGIPFYDGFKQIDEILRSEDSWLSFFKDHSDKSNINTSLLAIQLELLKAAPFPLKEKYRRLTELH